MDTTRPSKPIYYLEMAKAAAIRSTCMHRQCGCVIVKDDDVISTGYEGAPRGTFNCRELGECFKDTHGVGHEYQYELCGSVHAAQNAIISASRDKMNHSTLYIYRADETDRIVDKPDLCVLCKRMVINAGIDEVIFADREGIAFDKDFGYGYKRVSTEEWAENYGNILENLADHEETVMKKTIGFKRKDLGR